MDVYYDKTVNSCKLVNLAKKIFCLKPSNDKSIPPLIWNQKLNECFMSPEYCSYFGLSFDSNKKECHLPGVQKFFEDYLFGKTLTRTILHPSLIFNHEVTKDIIPPYQCNQVSSEINTSDEESTLSKISKDVLIGLTPDISLHISSLSLQYLYKFTKNLTDNVSKNILLSEINTVVADTLIINTLKALQVCSKVASSWQLFLIYFLGSTLDVVDTLNLNKALTSYDFKNVMIYFDKSFNDKTKIQTVTPEMILSVEVIQLKLKKQISQAYNLQYGGIDKLISIMNLYMKDSKKSTTIKNNNKFNTISNFKIIHHKSDFISFMVTVLILIIPLGIVSPVLFFIILTITLLFLFTKNKYFHFF